MTTMISRSYTWIFPFLTVIAPYAAYGRNDCSVYIDPETRSICERGARGTPGTKPQFDINRERIGPLRLDMPEKDAAAGLHCLPPRKSKEEYEAATAVYVQDWGYPDCGIRLGMSSDHKGDAKKIRSITVKAPSQLATSRGIHIGSSEAEVAQAYGQFRDPENSKAGSEFVAGSVYDGLIFSLGNGKVVAIFLGAAAE